MSSNTFSFTLEPSCADNTMWQLNASLDGTGTSHMENTTYPYDSSDWTLGLPVPDCITGSAASGSNLGIDPVWDMAAFPDPSNISFNEFSSLSDQNLFAPAFQSLGLPLWDLTSPSFFAPPSASMPFDGNLATPNSTTTATLSATPFDISTATITCQWKGCGTVVDATSIAKHLRTVHPGEISQLRKCRWSGCEQAPADLRKHVILHYNVELPCDMCGETFTREDALRRHQRRGTCKRCSWCRVLFDSTEERTVHVNTCVKRGVAAKAGRTRRVGKVGVSARQAAQGHPYMK